MITQLNLETFRNYPKRQFSFTHPITVIAGQNATGKTNILEAIYVSCLARSFRAKDPDMVSYGANHYRVEVIQEGHHVAVAFSPITKPSKLITHDSVKASLVNHIGRYPVVLFEPNDLQLLYGSPDLRRRYIDRILEQTTPEYTRTLHRYRRVLQQRNALLGQASSQTDLFAWNIKLADYGSALVRWRRQFIEDVTKIIYSSYQDIAAAEVELTISYHTNANNDPDTYLRSIEKNHSRDISEGVTLVGPHRDDLIVSMRGVGLTQTASRGEVRSVLLALKYAEISYLYSSTGRKPVVLLDDVLSELDTQRRARLTSLMKNYQVFITTTDTETIKPVIKDFEMVSTNG